MSAIEPAASPPVPNESSAARPLRVVPAAPEGDGPTRGDTDRQAEADEAVDAGQYQPLAPAAGLLRVVAGPEDVEVVIGDIPLGSAPVEVFVSPGVYRLLVRRRGFAKYDALVRIDDQMITSVEAFLQPLSNVPRTPANAEQPRRRSGMGYGTVAMIGLAAAAAGLVAYRYSKTPDTPDLEEDEEGDRLPASKAPAGEIEAPRAAAPEPRTADKPATEEERSAKAAETPLRDKATRPAKR